MALVLPLKLNFKQVPKLGKSDHFCTMHVCELTNEVLKNAHFFRQTKSFKTFTACLSIWDYLESFFDHLLYRLSRELKSTKLFRVNFMSLRKNSGCQQDEFIGKGVLFSFVMASTFWKMDDSKRNLLFEQLRNGQILTKSPYSRNDFRSYTIYQSQGG